MPNKTAVIAHVLKTADSLDASRTNPQWSKATPADLADLDDALSRVDTLLERMTNGHLAVPPRHAPHDSDSPDAHEGATEAQVGDRTGPGAGYDDEPEQVKDKGGVVS